jgi:mRNA-degrading endonuclease RelE of RelBE toxin-antitoxin system
MRDLLIEKSVKRTWTAQPQDVQDRLRDGLAEVASERKPTDHQNVILMDGVRHAVYRYRSGNQRVIFTIDNGRLLVWRVGERQHVYDNLNQTYSKLTP